MNNVWTVKNVLLGLSLVASMRAARAEELATVAATPAPHPTVVSIDPVGLVWGNLGGQLERAVTPHLSWVISGSGRGSANIFASGTVNDSFSVEAHPGFNLYLTGSAPEGLWVGPRLTVGWTHIYIWQFDGSTAPGNAVSLGAQLAGGYTMVLFERLVIGASASLLFTRTLGGPPPPSGPLFSSVGALSGLGVNAGWMLGISPQLLVGVRL